MHEEWWLDEEEMHLMTSMCVKVSVKEEEKEEDEEEQEEKR